MSFIDGLSEFFIETFFSDGVEHQFIDGRHNLIIYKNIDSSTKEILSKMISSLCSSNDYARKFPFIKFVVDKTPNNAESRYSVVYGDEIDDGKNPIIHIHGDVVSDAIKRKPRNDVVDDINYSITQNLVHIWQEFVTKTLSNRIKSSVRLEKSKTMGSIFTKLDNENILSYRIDMFNLIRLVQQNGIAVFCTEEIKHGMSFDTETADQLYYVAAQEADRIDEEWESYLKNVSMHGGDAKLTPELTGLSTDSIGLHMVYTILYHEGDRTDIDKAIAMKPFQFIKTYEKSIAKSKRQPIVSFNSGSGKVDYSRILDQWNRILKFLDSKRL